MMTVVLVCLMMIDDDGGVGVFVCVFVLFCAIKRKYVRVCTLACCYVVGVVAVGVCVFTGVCWFVGRDLIP
jgi:hypothetical protein